MGACAIIMWHFIENVAFIFVHVAVSVLDFGGSFLKNVNELSMSTHLRIWLPFSTLQGCSHILKTGGHPSLGVGGG